MSTQKSREFMERWDSHRDNIVRSTPVPHETDPIKRARIARLEANPEDWFAYYFPNYYTAPSASFHRQATRRVIKHNRWYEVRRWARDLAKSTRGMMEDLYMAMTGRARNFLLVSHSYDNAEELLMPYMVNLEANARLINDYGKQTGFRQWEMGHFVTRKGLSFRSIGAGQSPRGTRNEAARPDVIRIDDIDTDERCRNEKRMKDTWEWVEQALIPTVSVSGNVRIIFQGNLISKNSIIAKASEKADHVETVNIRDKSGNSSWKDKNSEEHINWLLSKMSYISAQKEYFNDPISEGTVFKEVNWGKVPQLGKFKFLVLYSDPSFKDGKKNDFKATWLMGKIAGVLYIIWGRLEQTSTRKMVGWHYEARTFVANEAPVYYYMEANFVQDILLDQFSEVAQAMGGDYIPIRPDHRKKPDKFTRIESALEPLNSAGRLVFNEKYKGDNHFERLKEQFLALEPGSNSHDDGPDAIEGGNYIIDTKTISSEPVTLGVSGKSSRKF